MEKEPTTLFLGGGGSNVVTPATNDAARATVNAFFIFKKLEYNQSTTRARFDSLKDIGRARKLGIAGGVCSLSLNRDILVYLYRSATRATNERKIHYYFCASTAVGMGLSVRYVL